MIALDKDYWESRYKNNQTGWDLGKVSSPIRAFIDQLEDKNCNILIPGAGNSYEAEYLLSQGFKNVTVLDIAKKPLENLQKKNPDNMHLNYVQDDFFNHTRTYDLIIEQTFFCALELRFRESYFKKASQLLNSHGVLAGVLFNFTQQRTTPPFGGSKEEYINLSDGYFIIRHLEHCHNSEASRQGKELFFKFIKA